MNIDSSNAIRSCTSCQVCGAVCPTESISIKIDKDGFYRPQVDSNKCIDCGLCVKCCYKFDENIKKGPLNGKGEIYSAWVDDLEILNSTTSGGIADVLASSFISHGYKCIGVIYDFNDNIAKGVIASTQEEIVQFRGSKYIQALTVDAFKELVKNNNSEKYAVFGLPCHIYGLDKFLKLRNKRGDHILVDLYCHGCPSLNLWKKYIGEKIDGVSDVKVRSVEFRSKVRGWGRFCVKFITKNNAKEKIFISPRINDSFYLMFFSDLILNTACYDCKLRSSLEYTDIRLGDFWGPKFLYNHKGVSGVTLCTEAGINGFELIKEKIKSQKESFDSFLPYQSYGKKYIKNMKTRELLLTSLSNPKIKLDTIVKEYKNSLSTKSRLILWITNSLRILPNPVFDWLHKLMYCLKN